MKVWKRNAVVAAIVLFVCVAVYLNWSYSQDKGVSADALPTGKLLGGAALVVGEANDDLLTGIQKGDAGIISNTYFASARINRQQARDSALGLLEDAAASQSADQTMKDEANRTMQTMAVYTMAEAEIENLVTAKGFHDCVAFLGADSASIVVAAVEGGLTESDTAKIIEIVMGESGLTASQIKIIETE